jgi:DNA-directed RNA polymerase specialized sigma24 family protein
VGLGKRIVEIGILMDRLDAKDPDAARMADMHYFAGFTLEEIAQETGLTLKQVRTRWERGLKCLKRMLHAKARGGRSALPDLGV